MYPIYILQWFFRGNWEEIGWRASTPESHDALVEHGYKMAASGGRYRLAALSPFLGGDPKVVHVYPVVRELSEVES